MIIDHSAVRDDWYDRGFSCDIWIDPPGKIWTDFFHDTDELLMLIDGEIELEMDDNILHPKIGDEVLIPAGMSHTVRNIGLVTNHWFYGYKYN
ncbi:MAG: cupin domain-containing protein [Candidatus Marinimicrobia bacterium]|nr:cupin domain-containing protein [Candidatus Neomarinimicrobiota bacterium]HJM47947.1 cupin domain-containing protein [Candidatus Neomarinimicrobiota bacterium]